MKLPFGHAHFQVQVASLILTAGTNRSQVGDLLTDDLHWSKWDIIM